MSQNHAPNGYDTLHSSRVQPKLQVPNEKMAFLCQFMELDVKTLNSGWQLFPVRCQSFSALGNCFVAHPMRIDVKISAVKR